MSQRKEERAETYPGCQVKPAPAATPSIADAIRAAQAWATYCGTLGDVEAPRDVDSRVCAWAEMLDAALPRAEAADALADAAQNIIDHADARRTITTWTETGEVANDHNLRVALRRYRNPSGS